jgi:hypothetical protein
MAFLTARGRSRMPLLLIFAVALGLVGSLASIPLGPLPKAAAADPITPGWYMIMSDYYDGINDGDGTSHCLSANGQPSTSGAGTHSIYLAPCNSGTPGQWWRLLSTGQWDQLRNWQHWDGATWCLSGNQSTPGGAPTSTHGAYTSACRSTTEGQYWSWYKIDTNNRWNIQHFLNWSSTQAQWLSATKSLPDSYPVFTANSSYEPVWRLYAPGSPPHCPPTTTCG